jgi:hypothetical protein
MAYCTAAEIREAGAQIGTTTFTDNYLNAVIERASRFFDHLCGVEDEFFEPAEVAASAKVVYGDGGPYLRLPPYIAGTLNTTLSVPDGYTAPTFTERDGYLILTSESSGALLTRSVVGLCYGGWWNGLPITVSARWGYEATPADVKLAVIEMVINVLRETDPATLNLLDLERQPLREEAPPRVKQVAEFYQMQRGVLV